MTITNAEHVHRVTFLKVWRQNERVLVHPVGVAWLVAYTCCKSKLSHHVLQFHIGLVRRVGRSWSCLRFVWFEDGKKFCFCPFRCWQGHRKQLIVFLICYLSTYSAGVRR